VNSKFYYNTRKCFSNKIILDTSDCFTYSFTEFFPFCSKLYYLSSFKDFNNCTPA